MPWKTEDYAGGLVDYEAHHTLWQGVAVGRR